MTTSTRSVKGSDILAELSEAEKRIRLAMPWSKYWGRVRLQITELLQGDQCYVVDVPHLLKTRAKREYTVMMTPSFRAKIGNSNSTDEDIAAYVVWHLIDELKKRI